MLFLKKLFGYFTELIARQTKQQTQKYLARYFLIPDYKPLRHTDY